VTTSQTQFLSDILDGEAIPDGAFVYFRGDLENQAHSLLLKVYHKRRSEEDLSQKEYAARIHHTAEVVNRHIAVAGNWQLDTIADYFLGLRARLVLSVVYLEDLKASATQTVPLTPNTSQINVQQAVNALSFVYSTGPRVFSPEVNMTAQAATVNTHQPLTGEPLDIAGLGHPIPTKLSGFDSLLNERRTTT
jgi:hypothetical protein